MEEEKKEPEQELELNKRASISSYEGYMNFEEIDPAYVKLGNLENPFKENWRLLQNHYKKQS